MPEYSPSPFCPWHDATLLAIRSALGRGNHAILLGGQKGVGKEWLARRIAHALLCDHPTEQGEACGTCQSCRWLATGSHPDLLRLEPRRDEEEGSKPAAAEQRSRPIVIDQVRELVERIALTAHRGGHKVVIVAPAEALNPPAANALLKNLEEPPPRTVFLLVSHRTSLLLPTIRSRCQSFPVRVRDGASAIEWLERAGLPQAGLRLAYCGGAPLEALATRDDPNWSRRASFLQALVNDGDGVRLAESCKDLPPPVLLTWMQKWTYDLLALVHGGSSRYSPDLAHVAGSVAARADLIGLARYHRRLLAAQRSINHPLNAQLLFEALLIGYFACIRPGNRSGLGS